MEVHEIKHGLLSNEALTFIEPFGCSMRRTSFETDLMLGTPQFPAFHLPAGSNVLPFQHDTYNCGVAVPCALAIVLRAVIIKDMNWDHPEIEYAKYFSAGELPLNVCKNSKKSNCDMPLIWFKPLPTKKTLVWDHYLAMVREQWFLMLDWLAELQHKIQPCEDYHNYQVFKTYSEHADLIASIWHYSMDDQRRKAGGAAPYLQPATEGAHQNVTSSTATQSQSTTETSTVNSVPSNEYAETDAEDTIEKEKERNEKDQDKDEEMEETGDAEDVKNAEDEKDAKQVKEEEDVKYADEVEATKDVEDEKAGEAGDVENEEDRKCSPKCARFKVW